MSAQPISHAERLRKRHDRVAAARTAVTPGPASEADARARSFGAVEAAEGEPRGEPGARAEDAEAPIPFAGFMGCAP